MTVYPVLVLTANCGLDPKPSAGETCKVIMQLVPPHRLHRSISWRGKKGSRSSGASWNTTPADWLGYKVDSLHWWAGVVLLNQSGVIPAPGPDDSRPGPNGLFHFYASLWQCLLLAAVQTSKKGKHSPQGLHFIRLIFSLDAQVGEYIDL